MTEKKLILKEYRVIGNKTTQENIITREIPINVNDTVLTSELNQLLERTKSNLINTSLFNFVTVEPVYYDENNISLYITVEERWYWWPIPIFQVEETNFNTWWEERDVDKVNYGLFLAKENFRGRKERAMLLFQAGYTEKIGVKYVVPYLNKKKTNGFNLMFSYSRNHEIPYATSNNVRDYFRSESSYVRKEISAIVGYELRPKLYFKHNFNLEYRNIEIADSVVLLNSGFLTNGNSASEFFSFGYKLKRDKRNNKNYPTKGSYYDFGLNKHGLGLLDKGLNSFYVTTHFKKFWDLRNRVYWASSLKIKYTIKNGSYYLNQGLGFGNDLVRGYELYVVDGDHFGVFKTQIRYGLLENKMFNVKALKANRFNKIPISIYLGAYFDAGYVDSKAVNLSNTLENKMLYGGGVSADFVSYYDMVLRMEFSVNQLNENGLFLHFIAPI